ncbi:hypothetical protein FQA39_LY08969 [Lamprigera yunnana]|nr:hypothetical protein FQA39_LY08969 [Lamprigera yunnana]
MVTKTQTEHEGNRIRRSNIRARGNDVDTNGHNILQRKNKIGEVIMQRMEENREYNEKAPQQVVNEEAFDCISYPMSLKYKQQAKQEIESILKKAQDKVYKSNSGDQEGGAEEETKSELWRLDEVEEVDDGVNDSGSETEDIVFPDNGYEMTMNRKMDFDFCVRDMETIWLDTPYLVNILELREGTLSSTLEDQKVEPKT